MFYGISAWGNCNVKTLHRTALLQKRTIRTISNAKFNSHTDPLFKDTSIMKITDQNIFQSTLFEFDFITKYHLSNCSDLTTTFPTFEQLGNQISCMKPGAKPILSIHCSCVLFPKYGINGFIHCLRTCLVQNSKLL